MANLKHMPPVVLPAARLVAIGKHWKPAGSPLRIEKFSQQVEVCYTYRFAGQPPHNTTQSA